MQAEGAVAVVITVVKADGNLVVLKLAASTLCGIRK